MLKEFKNEQYLNFLRKKNINVSLTITSVLVSLSSCLDSEQKEMDPLESGSATLIPREAQSYGKNVDASIIIDQASDHAETRTNCPYERQIR